MKLSTDNRSKLQSTTTVDGKLCRHCENATFATRLFRNEKMPYIVCFLPPEDGGHRRQNPGSAEHNRRRVIPWRFL